MTKQQDKEIKKKAIEEIKKQIEIEENKVRNNPEVRKLDDEVSELYNKQQEKRLEFRTIKNQITRQYISNQRYLWKWAGRFDAKDIKPSVKEGIKNGLGAKFLNQISDTDMITVVQELISKDLEKTNSKKLELDIDNIQKEIDVAEDKRKEFNKVIDELNDKRLELYNDLNKKETPKQKEINRVVLDKLDELIPKIKSEVTKSMMVETLQEN
jgi:hypothetical protein